MTEQYSNSFIDVNEEIKNPVTNYSIQNIRITKIQDKYRYYFTLNTTESKEDFDGLIKIAFEIKEVGLGFYQSIPVNHYSPFHPQKPLICSVTLSKPPKSIDPIEGLDTFVWQIIQHADVVQMGKGKLMKTVEQ